MKHGEVSGAWATAEAIWVILLADPNPDIDALQQSLRFLLSPRLQQSDGGWPLVQSPPSTIPATADCVIAILRFLPLAKDQQLTEMMKASVLRGINWLKSNQNGDGGWGIEAETHESGKSRMFGTYYAIAALVEAGETFANSEFVKRAVKNILRSKNGNGSWGYERGKPGDVSNTARAVLCLLRAKRFTSSDPVIKQALSFILKNASDGLLWELSEERISTREGLLLFENYSPYIALYALLTCEYVGEETLRCLKWFIDTQNKTGCWNLKCPVTGREKESLSWVTSEVVHILSLADSVTTKSMRKLLDTAFKALSNPPPKASQIMEPLIESSQIIALGKSPYKTFVSRNVGDVLVVVWAAIAGFGLYQIHRLFLQNLIAIIEFKAGVFTILMLFSTYLMVYAKAGRVSEIREMSTLGFCGTLGAVAVFLATILGYLL
jgi:prenyltransferase beta subunit